MIKKRNYKKGDNVMVLGYPSVEFTITHIAADTSSNLVFSLSSKKDSGHRLKLQKDESHILCSVEEFNKV